MNKDAKPKRSESVISQIPPSLKVIIEQYREQVKDQSSEFKQVRQKGIFVETVIKRCSSDRNLKVGEEIGDFQPNTVRRREDSVQDTRCEIVKEPRVKGLKKEIRTYSDKPQIKPNVKNTDIFRKDASLSGNLVEQIKPAYVKEALLEQGLKEAWVNEEKDPETSEESPIDLGNIVTDINQFTASLENNIHNNDWHKLRTNLQKIHRYYMDNLQGSDPQKQTQLIDIGNQDNVKVDINIEQVQLDIDNMMNPFNTIINRSKTLNSHTENDLKVKEFYKKYNQTLLNRKKAFNDMKALQSMSARIEQRLTQIEMEIHASRRQLLQRGVQNK